MKLFKHMKDGGPESTVDGYWLIEWKKVFSIALLRFSDGTREAFHNHAFHSISWLLKGDLRETRLGGFSRTYDPCLLPIFTSRNNFHRVFSNGTSWVLTFRGPWKDMWQEWLPKEDKVITLTHGRKLV